MKSAELYALFLFVLYSLD